MSFFVLAAATAAVMAAAPKKKAAALIKPFIVTLDPPEPLQPIVDEKTITTEDEWRCDRADDLLVPDPQSIVPQQLLGGPIAQAIVVGIAAVNSIARALKWKQRCTIRGGVYDVLETVQRRPLRVWVLVELVPRGQPPIVQWLFDTKQGAISSTGIVPQREATIVGSPQDFSAAARHYLLNGGEPPAAWWPHVNIASWLHPVPASLRSPRVDVVRSDNTLAIGIWIPPRAPPSHLEGPLQHRVVDRPLDWRIHYWIGEPS